MAEGVERGRLALVDIRCPDNPKVLFARLVIDEHGIIVGYEVACRDCKRKDPDGRLVFHEYRMNGEWTRTRRVSDSRGGQRRQ